MENNKIQKYLMIGAYILACVVLFSYMNYWEMLFWRPRGIHFMRQTDSLSFISFYLKTGAGLFTPGTLTLHSIDGKTASEFPIIYYILSKVWAVFGRQEFLLRGLNVFLVFVGLYHVIKIYTETFGNKLIAFLLAFFMIASPVLIYYANNFLPDASAFGLTLIGLYFAHKHINHFENLRHSYLALLWLGFASLIKVSYFIYPLAYMATLLLSVSYSDRHITFRNIRSQLKPMLLLGLITLSIVAWNVYVISYNKTYNGYFLSTPRSYFILNDEVRKMIWDGIFGYWWNWHYPFMSMYFFTAAVVTFFILINRINFRISVFISFLLMGITSYFFLFFAQFGDHDYYIITMVPALAILCGYFIKQVLAILPNNIYSKLGIIVCLSFLVAKNMEHTATKIRWRYWAVEADDDIYSKPGRLLNGADKTLDSLGIAADAKIIFMPDAGFSGSTYFTNRFGWLLFKYRPDQLERIPKMVDEGANYAIVMDSAFLQTDSVTRYLDKCLYSDARFSLYSIQKHE